MAAITKIQWANTTVNPIMGCGGCELYPPAGKVLQAVADAMNEKDPGVDVTRHSIKRIFKKLVDDVFTHSENPHEGHKQTVNATNIWHLRKRFEENIRDLHGQEVATAADNAIQMAITCYAGVLHLNKGAKILDREGNPPGKDKPREVKTGYAPIFEMPTQFKGRSKKTANYKDLLGRYHLKTPWKERLPRLIFVSDMGDALSAEGDFPFLKNDLMPAIRSEAGLKHLWLWLTKRPKRMAKFADQIGGFPANVCAMTTLTGPDEESLQRLSDLKLVSASMRGLSVEPLWDRIPPDQLDLKGIDWVILGGESGSGDLTRPFALEWVEELREHCRENGVAFFLKQLGKIKEGKLWRAGGHTSWDNYCRSVAGMSRIHAHRLVEATEFVDMLKTLPRGNILPQMEAQVRPLLRIPKPEQRAEAWFTAVEEAGGQQPTGPQIRKVVFDVLHPEGTGEKNQSRAQQRQDAASRLKAAIGERNSWEEVATLLEKLEKLL